MSKTPQFTVEQVGRALEQSKGLVAPAARALKCSQSTVRNYIKRHPTLEQTKIDEREKMIDAAEAALYKQIMVGDITAIIFTLKTIGRDRGYIEKRIIAGDDDAPIRHKHDHKHEVDLSDLSDDELDLYEHIITKAAAKSAGGTFPHPN